MGNQRISPGMPPRYESGSSGHIWDVQEDSSANSEPDFPKSLWQRFGAQSHIGNHTRFLKAPPGDFSSTDSSVSKQIDHAGREIAFTVVCSFEVKPCMIVFSDAQLSDLCSDGAAYACRI